MNFGSPESTPEHNRLQNKFLDEDFCLQFALHLYPDCEAQIKRVTSAEAIRQAWQTNVALRIAHRYKQRGRPWVSPDKPRSALAEKYVQLKTDVLKELKHDISSIVINCMSARNETPRYVGDPTSSPATTIGRVWEPVIKVEDIRFEAAGADVQFGLSGYIESIIGQQIYGETPSSRLCYFRFPERGFRIEVKPFVGDDYPVILLAMVANQCNALLVDRFEADGASWEQLKKIFAGHRIRVALLEDVLLTEIPTCLRSVALPTIDPEVYLEDAVAALEKYHFEWAAKDGFGKEK